MPPNPGPVGDFIANLIAGFEALIGRLVGRLTGRAADRISRAGRQSLGAGVVHTLWTQDLDRDVVPALTTIWTASVGHTTAQLRQLTDLEQVVAALTAPDPAGFLRAARNRLVGIGDIVWDDIRQELATGVEAGDDIPALAGRVRATAQVATPRSLVIARTEVVSAHNAASLAQARMLDDPAMVKEWLCVGPGTRVASMEPVEVVERRRAAGWLATLRTRNGRFLTVTPNHPVLTDHGWIRVHSLNVGDNLVCYGRPQLFGVDVPGAGSTGLVGRQEPDVQDVPPAIDEVFCASAQGRLGRRVVLVSVDLYSDPADCEVEVVPVDRDLVRRLQTPLGQPSCDHVFALSDERPHVLLGARSGNHAVVGATKRAVGPLSCQDFRREPPPTVNAETFGPNDAGLALVSQADPSLGKPVMDSHLADAVIPGDCRKRVSGAVLADDLLNVDVDAAGLDGQFLGTSGLLARFGSGKAASGCLTDCEQLSPTPQPTSDRLSATTQDGGYFDGGLSGPVELDDVVDIHMDWCASGHSVYDLTTGQGWFVAGGIVVHNSTPDARTRETHRDADGQRVRVGEPFTVGDAKLDYPGDPVGPPGEVINCRCSMAFDFDDAPLAASAYDDEHHVKRDHGKFAHEEGVSGVVPKSPFGGMHAASDADRDNFRAVVGQAIPPGWSDVYIADDLATAALLVRGLDAKGRGQSIYSAAHTEHQAAVKFVRVQELAKHIDKLDHAVERDAATDDSAAALLLIRRLGMRPGSNRNTGAKEQAHGATNLRTSHVAVDGDTTTFDFIGKKGVHIQLATRDPLIASTVKARLDRLGPDVPLFDTTEDKTREYMRSTGVPAGFLLKDLRTLHANVVALRTIAARGGAVPQTKTEFRQWRKAVAEAVSAELGNTPALALSAYINPTVFAPWMESESWS